MTTQPDFTKGNGLIPAVIQDAITGDVLMVGWMNQEAYSATCSSGEVTFFSRSRQTIWRKGETSGNVLKVRSISLDCDGDTFLIQAIPEGPTCHTGARTCFGEQSARFGGFLSHLSETIAERAADRNTAANAKSYTSSLFTKGIDAMAQKVGEEAVEVVIESKNSNDDRLLDESADLLFHLMVLLRARGFSLADVEARLRSRSKA